jgi:hypothetical protein
MDSNELPLGRRLWNVAIAVVVMFMLTQWMACGWEHGTGLTFATRGRRGQVATAADLAESRNSALASTVFGACAGAAWWLTRRKAS